MPKYKIVKNYPSKGNKIQIIATLAWGTVTAGFLILSIAYFTEAIAKLLQTF